MATGSGNAKTIFLGEHFVVYGAKAIGFGLDKKIVVEVKRSARSDINFLADENFKKALEILKASLGVENFTVDIASSQISPARGLGSSAALSVATIRAISREFNLNSDDQKVNELAYAAEKIFHGTPSGIDNTLATFGGAIIFQKKSPNNLIEPLKIGAPLHLVLVDSEIRGETRAMVEKVRAFREKNTEPFLKLMEREAAIVKAAIPALKNGQTKELGNLMGENQLLLDAIGVTHAENKKIIAACRKSGALGTKLVGAGGGGFCLALMESEGAARKITRVLKKQYACFYNLIPKTP